MSADVEPLTQDEDIQQIAERKLAFRTRHLAAEIAVAPRSICRP